MDAHRTAAGLLIPRGPDAENQARRLRRAAQRGDLIRLRRGVFVEKDTWLATSPEARARMRIHAFAAVAAAPPVFSHQSAAVLHALPLLVVDEDTVHVSVRSVSGGRKEDGLQRHARNWESPAILRDGLLVTDLLRTSYDLAATLPFREAVVSVDAALRCGVDPRALKRLMASPGAFAQKRVGSVVAFASPLSESPGESLSRALMEELGAARPWLQQEFTDEDGLIGRVDFWWPSHGVVGEFDGRLKYGDRYGGSPEERLWREKQREDRLRAKGFRVIRWTWKDLMDPSRFSRLLASAGLLS